MDRKLVVLLRREGLLVAASIVVLAALALDRPATPPAPAVGNKSLPAAAFETKALVGPGVRRQRDARLMLADGKVTVTASATKAPLHSVAYEDVASITYSRGVDPMWSSPNGTRTVTRAPRQGALGMFGISRERHWISLQTNAAGTPNEFVIFHVAEALVGTVLSALEERTGRTPARVHRGARR